MAIQQGSMITTVDISYVSDDGTMSGIVHVKDGRYTGVDLSGTALLQPYSLAALQFLSDLNAAVLNVTSGLSSGKTIDQVVEGQGVAKTIEIPN